MTARTPYPTKQITQEEWTYWFMEASNKTGEEPTLRCFAKHQRDPYQRWVSVFDIPLVSADALHTYFQLGVP